MEKIKIYSNEPVIQKQMQLNKQYITDCNSALDALSESLGVTLKHEDVSLLCTSPMSLISKLGHAIQVKAQALDPMLYDVEDYKYRALSRIENAVERAHKRLLDRPFGMGATCYKVEDGRFVIDSEAANALRAEYTTYVENPEERHIWQLANDIADDIRQLQEAITSYTGAHIIDAAAIANFTEGTKAVIVLQGVSVNVNPGAINCYKTLRHRNAYKFLGDQYCESSNEPGI